MIERIWATGSTSATSDSQFEYHIHIILADGTRKDFSGYDIDKVHYEVIKYILPLYREKTSS